MTALDVSGLSNGFMGVVSFLSIVLSLWLCWYWWRSDRNKCILLKNISVCVTMMCADNKRLYEMNHTVADLRSKLEKVEEELLQLKRSKRDAK